MRSRKLKARAATAMLLALMALPLLGVTSAQGSAKLDPLQGEPRGRPLELIALMLATAQYHNVEVALADGYIEKPINGVVCVTHHHLGAMGIHYLNPDLVGDGVIETYRPEVLLYEPVGDHLKLVGVEYFIPDTGQVHPTVLGRRLDGPNQGLEPGMPVHYSLHVWNWKRNPLGMFAPYNPAVSCPS